MERSLKVWGERVLIRQDSTHCVSLLKLRKETRCSWHKHASKSNLFYLISGEVWVKTQDGVIKMQPGQTVTVHPGRWHEFEVIQDSMMIEEMYVEYDESDILRADEGSSWMPPTIRKSK